MMNMRIVALLALVASVGIAATVSPLALAQDNVDFDDISEVDVQAGERFAEFQSSGFPYIDRRELRVSEGMSGTLDLSAMARLQHQDRFALHMLNDTDKNVQVLLPELERSFLVMANTDRVYEMIPSEMGFHNEVDYEIRILESANVGGIVQNNELNRIINQRVVIPTFEDDEPTYYTAAPSAPVQRRQPVRAYW